MQSNSLEVISDRVWPPDYNLEIRWRIQKMKEISNSPDLIHGAKLYYKTRPIEFINHWIVTYDPRTEAKIVPFILFRKQEEFILFLQDCLGNKQAGLVEKSRDVGASYLSCAFSLWLWLFHPNSAVGWGSRKEDLLDKAGDMSSVFPKIRQMIEFLPPFLRPKDYNPRLHATHMKIINPENGSTIIGEAGDGQGRGGRTTIYFKDEAQPLTAKILTPTGWSTMGDMIIGSSVIGADGKERKVTHINDCGVFDVYRVKFSDGTFADCSPNHLWTVETRIGKHEVKTLRTSEIIENVSYVSPRGKKINRYKLQTCLPVRFKSSSRKLPLHPYLVGALLGDGSVKDVPNHCPKITTADKEIADYFHDLLPTGCVLKYDSRYQYRIVDERGRMGNKKENKSRARKAMVDAGIAGHGSATKFIPDLYKFSSPKNRLAILQGLMDTDGSASSSVVTFHTGSPRLAEDVMFIVQSLGGTATHNVKKDHRKESYLDLHVLHIVMPKSIIPFRLKRKILRMKRKHSSEKMIIGIEKIGNAPVRCITVDAEDGLYLTDSFIVTHNCAHYEHPELIEASLSANTDVQIDISSVNGTNNVFYRKRLAGEVWTPRCTMPRGKTRVFVFDWKDNPLKNQDWYDEKRKKWEDDGLLHIFAQEVDRDYAASVDGVIIPTAWVKAAIDAHIKLGIKDDGIRMAGLDVADEGGDKNALAVRYGVVLRHCSAWGEGDTGVTARRAMDACRERGVTQLNYDCIGVGAGVKAETNRLIAEAEAEKKPLNINVVPFNAGSSPDAPEKRVISGDSQSPRNEDFFSNLKAQTMWLLRGRFEKTYKAVTQGMVFPHEELISIDSTIPCLHEIERELSQPTRKHNGKGKLVVNKKPDGGRSPNLCDAIVQCYWEKISRGFFA